MCQTIRCPRPQLRGIDAKVRDYVSAQALNVERRLARAAEAERNCRVQAEVIVPCHWNNHYALAGTLDTLGMCPDCRAILCPPSEPEPRQLPEGVCRTCRHEGLLTDEGLCLHCLDKAGGLKRFPLN